MSGQAVLVLPTVEQKFKAACRHLSCICIKCKCISWLTHIWSDDDACMCACDLCLWMRRFIMISLGIMRIKLRSAINIWPVYCAHSILHSDCPNPPAYANLLDRMKVCVYVFVCVYVCVCKCVKHMWTYRPGRWYVYRAKKPLIRSIVICHHIR